MKFKKIALGTVAYTVGTFSLAIVWHVVLFEDLYRAFGYFDDEPNFLLGFLTIMIQGVVLSGIYPLVELKGPRFTRGLKFAFLLGGFFWTSHVLAFLAKQDVPQAGLFAAMETFYLVCQFGLFGVFLGLIFGPSQERSTEMPNSNDKKQV